MSNKSTLIIRYYTPEAIAILRGVIDFYEAECLLYKINQVSKYEPSDDNKIELAHQHFRHMIMHLIDVAEILFGINVDETYRIAYGNTLFDDYTEEDLYYEIKWGLGDMLEAIDTYDKMPYYKKTPEKSQEYQEALAYTEEKVERIISQLREILMVSLTA